MMLIPSGRTFIYIKLPCALFSGVHVTKEDGAFLDTWWLGSVSVFLTRLFLLKNSYAHAHDVCYGEVLFSLIRLRLSFLKLSPLLI